MTTKHELGNLIDATMKANGWSLREISQRARSQGHSLSQQNLSRIRSEPVVHLVAKQARGLAAGLDVPVAVVVDAALRSMGFAPTSPLGVTPEEAVLRDEHLGARDRRVVSAVLRELRRAEEGESAAGATVAEPESDGPISDNVQRFPRRRPERARASEDGAERRSEAARSSRVNPPAHAPDDVTGEESQDDGGHGPA